jgi:dihydroneopterin triphosphate diphosphatase
MRAPLQVLVIPFRRTAAGLEFAVLRRSDAGWWQFVAGGGEDDESPQQAAERETREELGITVNDCLLPLDARATVPRSCFPASDAWGHEVYVIPEHCFAIHTGDSPLVLSGEHSEVRWVSYDQACSMLRWDSNRTALWELNERLKKVPNQLLHYCTPSDLFRKW